MSCIFLRCAAILFTTRAHPTTGHCLWMWMWRSLEDSPFLSLKAWTALTALPAAHSCTILRCLGRCTTLALHPCTGHFLASLFLFEAGGMGFRCLSLVFSSLEDDGASEATELKRDPLPRPSLSKDSESIPVQWKRRDIIFEFGNVHILYENKRLFNIHCVYTYWQWA